MQKMGIGNSDTESQRLRSLYQYEILDTGPDDLFDELARLAAFVSKTPIALISFIDQEREWFKSITGIDLSIGEIKRDKSFGSALINQSEDLLAISDPLDDIQLKANPLIAAYKDMHFYAGVPIVNKHGYKIGALSVVGHKVKELTHEQVSLLHTIAKQIMLHTEQSRNLAQLEVPLAGLSGGPKNKDDRNVESSVSELEVYGGNDTAVAQFKNPAHIQEHSEQYTEDIHSLIYRLEQSNKKLLLLCEMDEKLQTSSNVEDINNVVTYYSRLLYPSDSGVLYLMNDTLNILEDISAWGENTQSVNALIPDDCWGVRLGRLHTANKAESSLKCTHANSSDAYSSYCSPIVAQGKTLGLLYLESSENVNDDANHGSLKGVNKTQIISTVTKHTGLAIANIRQKETFRTHAVYDSLTGLFNRRYMEETLKRELSRVSRKKVPLGLIMADIDHFKNFNDSFGHAAGDMLLRSIGTFFKDHIRSEDIACRYGGEEFVLILPESSLENTLKRARQMHEEIKHLSVWHGGRLIDSVNVSMGVVVFSEHGTSAETLLESADRALYQAKSEGRDRIVVA